MESKLLESIMREFSWSRSINSYKKVQILYSKIIRGNAFQLKKLRNKNFEYLNVGCGESNYPNFLNLDYQWRPHVHICWDITKGIPLDSNSMKGIFIEHCLEHITFSQCQDVLKELYRILRSNGTIRVIVPDAEFYIELYKKGKNGEIVSFPYVTEKDIKNGFTSIMAINRIFRNHGHQYAYDAQTLIMQLKKAGYGSIRKVNFMNGVDEKLLIDSEFRKVESLYIEASKV